MGVKRFKCTVVGDAGVGKNCLIMRIARGMAPQDIEFKAFETYDVKMMVDQTPLEIVFWNTAGES